MWRRAWTLAATTARASRDSCRSVERLHELVDTVAAVVSEFDVRTRRFT
ncbi:MAG: hypothetical protein H0U07_10855 [Actinobacteria bacterium]|nr:hypothetical protein [Actinomycetota bacterium]MDQ3163812.1 hypothetical protein [Actinomycetota bacterium]